MSRTWLGLTATVLAVTFVVAIVRGQEDGSEPSLSAPQEQASTQKVEPIPSAVSNSPFLQDSNGPTPALASPTQAIASDTGNPSSDTGTSARRPSAAERLKQVRESTDRSGKNATPRKPSASLGGPVANDPAELGRGSIQDEPTPTTPAIISPDEAKPAASISDGRSGGTSVLKKSEASPLSDRSTARRVFRTPGKTSNSEPSATSSSRTTAIPGANQQERATGSATLSVSQGPGIRVETVGPSAVVINKEAEYTLVVHNDSDVAVTEVLLRVGLPATVRATGEGASAETVAAGEGDRQRLGWTIPKIGPRSSERLSMRITPTENRPIDLMIDWTIRPVSTMAQIEVRQPQLELSVFGRRDVLYGESATYTIRLANPGTGDADDVSLQFGYGDSRLEPKQIGTLAAGQQTEVTVELNARQAGTIQVKAMATGSGGLKAEAAQDVFVRRAKLEIEVTGDAVKFAGSAATYRVAIRNAGDAPATEVAAAINLPRSATVKRAGDGAKVESDGVAWNIGTLPPNGERVLDLQCVLASAGDNTISVRATGAAEVEASGSFVTRVEALADLKLSVVDPAGPVEIGKEAVYEIHIVNMGTKAATSVSVVAQFSRGIEPLEASGGQAELVPGQVIFQPITRIEPGQEVKLIIKARADSEGNKLFRAEVGCEESNTQLVAQEATYFFNETTRRASASGPTQR